MVFRYLLFIFIILPNTYLSTGVPIFDFLVILLFSYNLLETKKFNKAVGVFLLVSLYFLFPVIITSIGYDLDYFDFWGRYLLAIMVLSLPKIFFSLKEFNSWFFEILFTVLILIGLFNFDQLMRGIITRRQIEFFGFNDLNIYLTTLFLISILGRYSIIKVFIVMIISAIFGARIVLISTLLYLFSTKSKFAISFMILIIPYFILKNQDIISNLEIINRFNNGFEDDGYSRATIWKYYIQNSFEICSYCNLKIDLIKIGLNIFRPAHNSFFSAIGILGLIPGVVFTFYLLKKLKLIFTFKFLYILPFILFFDIQYSRSIIFLTLTIIYAQSRNTNSSIQRLPRIN